MSEPAQRLPDDDSLPSAPHSMGGRPDWLVGSEQGAEDERMRGGETDGSLASGPELSEAPRLNRALPPTPVKAAEEDAKSSGPARWSAASSSVPKLEVVGAGTAAPPTQPESAELSRLSPPASQPRPIPPPAMGSHAESDEEGESLEADFPEDEFESPAPVAAAPPRPQLDEPFWVVWMDVLRGNPRLTILILAGVVLVLGAWIFWPRSEPGVSIRTLNHEARQRDGQTVRVNGRVGDVYAVGGAHAFMLLQGRDTIVVFTRDAAPRSRASVSVVGSVSTGYLDGLPRLAIFEQAGSRPPR